MRTRKESNMSNSVTHPDPKMSKGQRKDQTGEDQQETQSTKV